MATTRPLLDRLLNTADLAQVVPRLSPEVLHRVIQICGLEDSAEFVALATPAQLSRILDVDVWHGRTPGADEQFDVDRFGLWLDVLMQSGAAVAAEKLIGCSIQARPFERQEATNAAVGICNLGLEAWPRHWSNCDLVAAFQVGWTVLHRDVSMYAAERLIAVITGIKCSDRDIHMRLQGLRRELVQSVRDATPWRAREALDVIVMLDAPCWAALVALTDECPVMHAAIRASRDRARSVNPSDYEFISQRSQIAVVREFMESLAARLAP
jgi:hypothetical protein